MNGPLHFTHKGKWETCGDLNSTHFSIIPVAGASPSACVPTRLTTSAHFLISLVMFHEESPAAVQNLMWWAAIVDLVSFQVLLILLGEVQGCSLGKSASLAFLQACSWKISCTCYKGLTESTAWPTHFFQWFLALADLYPLQLHANVQTLSNMRRWCAQFVIYSMYCLKSEIYKQWNARWP